MNIKKMINKKGQEMSVTTIIIIILGLVVMVVLILGFTIGWDKMKGWIMPSNNIAAISDQCKIACGTEQKYSYCSEKRELKSKEETLKDVSCYSLAKIKPAYGIESCPTINCGIYDNLAGAKAACSEEDQEIFYLDTTKIISYKCAAADIITSTP